MCIFNAVKKESVFGFTIDELFGNFTNLHSLYTIVELVHFAREPKCSYIKIPEIVNEWFFLHMELMYL